LEAFHEEHEERMKSTTQKRNKKARTDERLPDENIRQLPNSSRPVIRVLRALFVPFV
jgi:hypothetical protein